MSLKNDLIVFSFIILAAILLFQETKEEKYKQNKEEFHANKNKKYEEWKKLAKSCGRKHERGNNT